MGRGWAAGAGAGSSRVPVALLQGLGLENAPLEFMMVKHPQLGKGGVMAMGPGVLRHRSLGSPPPEHLLPPRLVRLGNFARGMLEQILTEVVATRAQECAVALACTYRKSQEQAEF